MALVTKKAQYDMEYRKTKLKQISFTMQKAYFEEVLAPAAEKTGEPINTFIKTAIAERVERLKDRPE